MLRTLPDERISLLDSVGLALLSVLAEGAHDRTLCILSGDRAYPKR